EALRALWKASFPEEELHDLISEQWKEMGWQGKDPSTDFRGVHGVGIYPFEPVSYTALQCFEHCLQRLQNRLEIAYDSSIPRHQEALRALWKASFPEEELHDLISEQWKEMGWQGKDPSTDFRGGGFISLENLLYFARNFPVLSLSPML
nr:hypothetical protein [Tanacetum cinerariifolium]